MPSARIIVEVTVAVHLPDELAGRLAAAAARRGIGVDEIAVELVTAGLTGADTAHREPGQTVRRLSFAAVGASFSATSAADSDAMLADGFGRN